MPAPLHTQAWWPVVRANGLGWLNGSLARIASHVAARKSPPPGGAVRGRGRPVGQALRRCYWLSRLLGRTAFARRFLRTIQPIHRAQRCQSLLVSNAFPAGGTPAGDWGEVGVRPWPPRCRDGSDGQTVGAYPAAAVPIQADECIPDTCWRLPSRWAIITASRGETPEGAALPCKP